MQNAIKPRYETPGKPKNSLNSWRFQLTKNKIDWWITGGCSKLPFRRCRGTAPEPRYGHAAALVGGRVAWGPRWKSTGFVWELGALFGASGSQWILPLGVSFVVCTRGYLHEILRRSHTDSSNRPGTISRFSNQVYFGGRGKTSCFRDLHALDTSSHTWCLGSNTVWGGLAGGFKCDVHHLSILVDAGFHKWRIMGVPQNGRFIWENPIKMIKND